MTQRSDDGVTRRAVLVGLGAAGVAALGTGCEGVFIIGSGMSYHNMRGFRDRSLHPSSESFDAWLREAATAEPAERDRKLGAWAEAPAARACHPREEHLLPLMVIAGAAGADRGTIPYNGTIGGLRISAVHYG